VTRPEVADAEEADLAALGVEILAADVVDEARPTRHDPQKLARAIVAAYARLRPGQQGSSPLATLRAWTGILAPATPTDPSLTRAAFADLQRRR
jgi:hypothetical protein